MKRKNTEMVPSWTVDGKNFASARYTCLMRAGKFPRSTTTHPPHSPRTPKFNIAIKKVFTCKIISGKGQDFQGQSRAVNIKFGGVGVTKQKNKNGSITILLAKFFPSTVGMDPSISHKK